MHTGNASLSCFWRSKNEASLLKDLLKTLLDTAESRIETRCDVPNSHCGGQREVERADAADEAKDASSHQGIIVCSILQQ